MSLGERLRQARLEAGLSQRALCGEEITRNMLSQIENGTAGPSVATLRFLADRLGKPVSFFLDEAVIASPNREPMASARQCYDAGDFAGAVETLKAYLPDGLFDREKALLECLARLGWAEELQLSGKVPYAREILEKTVTEGLYCAEALERRRLLLLGRWEDLPSLDEELLLRAEGALKTGDPDRAGKLLDCAEDPAQPHWQLLRGMVFLKTGDHAAAAEHLKAAEQAYPKETAPLLEECYRELGNYRLAYEYACAARR